MFKLCLGTSGISSDTLSLLSPGTAWFVFVVPENMVKAVVAVDSLTHWCVPVGLNQKMLTELNTECVLAA